jgi:hypothetical protein
METHMKKTILCAAVAALLSSSAYAKVTADEAKQLGTTLTEIGAEKAGNASGTIPAFAGILPASKYPADYKPNSGRWTNPYRDEKPLYTITAANMAKYDAVLNDGSKEVLKRFPDYEMRVYPTHRDVGYPQYWLDKTLKNATSVSLTGNDGDGIEGGWGGIPFPIPKSGWEAMWNFRARYLPTLTTRNLSSYFVNSSGKSTLVSTNTNYSFSPWTDPKATAGDWLQKVLIATTGPARSAGELALAWDTANFANNAQRTWAYTPGQRRVKLAPEAVYDTPASPYGGVVVYDEFALFGGRYDRFDWKLVGKQELLIPYHTYDLDFNGSPAKALGPQHPNPDYVRWELHRVWVVEATLKKTARHIYSKRRFYLDEDSWKISASEAWDQAGKLYRLGYANTAPIYGDKTYIFNETATYYDLNKGAYAITLMTDPGANSGVYMLDKFPAEAPLTSEGLPSYGVR